jgi:hypothetical protein
MTQTLFAHINNKKKEMATTAGKRSAEVISQDADFKVFGHTDDSEVPYSRYGSVMRAQIQGFPRLCCQRTFPVWSLLDNACCSTHQINLLSVLLPPKQNKTKA